MDDQMQTQVSQDGFPTIDAPEENEQQTLFSLEELTLSNMGSIEMLQKKKRDLEQQIKDAYENDAIYHQKAEAAKVVVNDANAVKTQVMKQPSVMEMVNEVRSLRSEIKDKKFAISDYALEVLKHGVNQIEKDGRVFEIVTTARLVEKPASAS